MPEQCTREKESKGWECSLSDGHKKGPDCG